MKQFSRILQDTIYCCPLVRPTFSFLFCLGKKSKRESKCSAEFLFQKLKPDHPRAVCGLNISMDLVILSELFLGIQNHKYESHYCVWMEIFYGLRFVGSIRLVRKLLFGGWAGGSHRAPPELKPDKQRKKRSVFGGGFVLNIGHLTWI